MSLPSSKLGWGQEFCWVGFQLRFMYSVDWRTEMSNPWSWWTQVSPETRSAYRKIRKRILDSEPLCRACAERGLVEAATECDHIVPVGDGGSVTDPDNLQPLCSPCHLEKTSMERMSDETLDNNERTLGELAQFDDWGSAALNSAMKSTIRDRTSAVLRHRSHRRKGK